MYAWCGIADGHVDNREHLVVLLSHKGIQVRLAVKLCHVVAGVNTTSSTVGTAGHSNEHVYYSVVRGPAGCVLSAHCPF